MTITEYDFDYHLGLEMGRYTDEKCPDNSSAGFIAGFDAGVLHQAKHALETLLDARRNNEI